MTRFISITICLIVCCFNVVVANLNLIKAEDYYKQKQYNQALEIYKSELLSKKGMLI